MKVVIYTDDNKDGLVWYDTTTKEIMVTHPDASVRASVREYLTQEKPFRIPYEDAVPTGTPQSIQVLEKPSSSKFYMEMGLCEMYHAIGVHVNWGHSSNEGSSYEGVQKSIIHDIKDFDFLN